MVGAAVMRRRRCAWRPGSTALNVGGTRKGIDFANNLHWSADGTDDGAFNGLDFAKWAENEGIVYTRRCLGCVVADKGERHWLGRVLFVDSDDYQSYYYTALFSSFQRTLSEAGYLFSRVTCPVGKGGAAVDPILNGRVLAEHALTHLAPSARHRSETVGYRYIRGKTFAM